MTANRALDVSRVVSLAPSVLRPGPRPEPGYVVINCDGNTDGPTFTVPGTPEMAKGILADVCDKLGQNKTRNCLLKAGEIGTRIGHEYTTYVENVRRSIYNSTRELMADYTKQGKVTNEMLRAFEQRKLQIIEQVRLNPTSFPSSKLALVTQRAESNVRLTRQVATEALARGDTSAAEQGLRRIAYTTTGHTPSANQLVLSAERATQLKFYYKSFKYVSTAIEIADPAYQLIVAKTAEEKESAIKKLAALPVGWTMKKAVGVATGVAVRRCIMALFLITPMGITATAVTFGVMIAGEYLWGEAVNKAAEWTVNTAYDWIQDSSP